MSEPENWPGRPEDDPAVIASRQEMERRPGEEAWRWALRMLDRPAWRDWRPPGEPPEPELDL